MDMNQVNENGTRPGECASWESYRERLEAIKGDPELIKTIWQDTDFMAYFYIWQVLLSF